MKKKMASMDEESEKADKINMDSMYRTAAVLPWDRFSSWIHCACVVTFDLELGQALELIYPSHIKLTEKEKMNICYLSFPDSNSGCMGDTQFHFRIRQCPGIKQMFHSQYGRDFPVNVQSDSGYLYGYVYFRQTKDKSVRRGYFQKSVVLLSKLPFVALFTELVGIIAPEYFDNGEPSLEAACHDVDQWPSPVPGETVNLPLFGTVLQVRLPTRFDKLYSHSKPASKLPIIPAQTILPSLHEVDIFSAFHTILPHVQLLWELVLIGEPIVVMAASPAVTSQAVQSLVSLISPLKYCSDYRPYFTIHDSEFKEYTTRTQAPPPVILGVTNPFFTKTLQHWPHIIRIGDMAGSIGSPKGFNKLKKASSLKTLDSKPGVYTQYKCFLSKEKTILKRLVKGMQSKRPVEAQNAILRRYFLELTQSFMIPLERFVASLMPLQRNICPHKAPPILRPFDPDEFLRKVEESGPQLTSGIKGDWVGLYRKFFRSVNFYGWYNQRQQEVNQKLQVLHFEALSEANLVEWIEDKEEVEIVDLILRLRGKLEFAAKNSFTVNEESCQKLQKQMETITCSLPDDLQSVLKV